MNDDHHRLVVHGLDAKDITKFFHENTALDRDGSVVGSLSFARSVPIPPNTIRAEINQWLDNNWGNGVHEDASNTTHLLSLDGNAPKVEYKFYTRDQTQIDIWVEKISEKYPELIFELYPQWDGECGLIWYENSGESYDICDSDTVYLFKDGFFYSGDIYDLYLLGILIPNWRPESTKWGSFRRDLQTVTETLGRLIPGYFEAGNSWSPKADYLKGRDRTMFIIASYFAVLIDQTFHSYYNYFHHEYGRLTQPPKLIILGPNIDPDSLLRAAHLRDDTYADFAFRRAIPLVEKQLKDLVQQHFPKLKPDEVWSKISSHLPKETVFR